MVRAQIEKSEVEESNEEEPKPPTIRKKRIITAEWRYQENGNI